MAKNINTVQIMGNLTRDPEMTVTQLKNTLTRIGVAVNHSYKDSAGNWQEQTEFFDISTWGKMAEQVAEKAQKGTKVLIMGRLANRSWEKDGVRQSKVEIIANDVTFIDGAKAQGVN